MSRPPRTGLPENWEELSSSHHVHGCQVVVWTLSDHVLGSKFAGLQSVIGHTRGKKNSKFAGLRLADGCSPP